MNTLKLSAEELVETCWILHPQISFKHSHKNGAEDSKGIDFLNVTLPSYSFVLNIQVKTSDNGNTIGLVFPLSRENRKETRSKVSERMWKQIHKHNRLHPFVCCVLFVAKTGHRKSKSDVFEEIWKETKNIFGQYTHNFNRKNHRKGAPMKRDRKLAKTRRLCYI